MKKVIFALLALGAANAAQADIIPSLTVGSPVQVGSLFRYDYTATLAADQQLQSGNFFTIYDFQGFTNFGTVAANFSPSSQFTGITPNDVIPADNAGILNISFVYSGPTLNNPPAGGQGVSVELGTFQVFSTLNQGAQLLNFASRAIKNNGDSAGSTVSNVGFTSGPGAVPEPSVWAMLLVGFGAIGYSARRRNAVAVAA